MNKITLIAASLVCAIPALNAKGISPVGIDSLDFDRQGDLMKVEMNLDLSKVSVKSSGAQVITPLIVSEAGDTLALRSVSVYGRSRYLIYLRNDERGYAADGGPIYKLSERPESYGYMAAVPYQPWMDNCRLMIKRELFGCFNCLVEEKTDPVIDYFVPEIMEPKIAYFQAKDTGPIVETLEGEAYIDFIVDKTNIEPTYRRNPQELLKIQASIDTVLNDKDVTITGVWLKGFASPESPYAHNTDLAIGRTQALKEHIRQLYNFNPEIIATAYEPEDWEGLRKFVVASNIDHKEEILELIDSDMQPDPKEALIKKRFPKEYKFMLQNFYPALRHTNYRVTYEVKRFDDIDKIREVMRTRPKRLTLREFYLLADACVPGSDEYNEVFETAVRMYPDDPIANINAANAALTRKDFMAAERYLAKAGDAREAQYARAALAYSQGDYDAAEEILKTLPDMPQARTLLEQIESMRQVQDRKFKPIILE